MTISTKYAAAIFTVLLVGVVIFYFSDIVAYVIIAWVLSLIGQPFMRIFRKIRVGKFKTGDTTCAILTLATYVLIVVGLFSVFVPPVIKQTRNLAEVDYASLVKGLEEPITDWTNWAIDKGFIEGEPILLVDTTTQTDIAILIDSSKVIVEPEIVSKMVQTTTIQIDSLLRANGDTITQTNINLNIVLNDDHTRTIEKEPDLSDVMVTEKDGPLERLQKKIFSFFNPSQIQLLFGSIIGFFGNLAIALLSIFFITFFFLKEQQLFVRFLMAIIPNKYEKQVDSALTGISKMLTRYFGGIFIQVTIITIFVSVLLGILGVENALLIAFFAAVINVIPYIGPTIGAVFGIFIVISSNVGLPFYEEMLPLILQVAAVFAAMQMLDNFILQPVIFSNSVSAHPLEIFILILVGAKVGGILGMVLAIPVYTVLRVIAKVFLSEFKIVQKITGGMDGV